MVRILWTLVILLVLVVTYLLGRMGKLDTLLGQKSIQVSTPTPAVIIVTPQPTHTSTKTIDSDPIVTCTSSVSQCKGQSIIARRSECSKIICCGLLYGVYELFSDATKCKLEQTIELDANKIHLYNPPIQHYELPKPLPVINLDPNGI